VLETWLYSDSTMLPPANTVSASNGFPTIGVVFFSTKAVNSLWPRCCPGTLPPSWGALTKLKVCRLWRNKLSGPLLDRWSGMVMLEELDLSTNALTGEEV
jgi:hypothetical protein